MTLNEVMKDTADAIREKKGTSELIAPINFAEEIKSISAGGGESGGELVYMEYNKGTLSGVVVMFSSLVKVKATSGGMSQTIVSTPLMVEYIEALGNTLENVAFAFDPEARITNISTMGECTIREFLIAGGVTGEPIDIDTLPRITEAEFYDLNA